MGRMNCKNKFAVSIAGVLLLSGAAFGDELVQLGPVGGRASVSYIKRDAPKKSVVVNGDRQGGAGSPRSEQPHGKLVSHSRYVSNGVWVTYYTEEH
jgi:hypothetical protein